MGYTFTKQGPKSTAAREKVSLMVRTDQVVEAKIPHDTPQAPAIRECLKTKVLDDSLHKLFYFERDIKKWLSLHYESTDWEPKLTAQPVEVIEKAYAVLSKCPNVSSVTIVNEAGQVLKLEDIRAMKFSPVEATAPPEDVFAMQDQFNDTTDDTTDDEVALAVVDLQGDVKNVKADLKDTNIEIGSVNAKLARFEDENVRLTSQVIGLRDEMCSTISGVTAELQQLKNTVATLSVRLRVASLISGAKAEPSSPDEPTDAEPSDTTAPFTTFEEFNEQWHDHIGFGKKALTDAQLRQLAGEQPQFTARVAATDAALFFGPMPTKFRALAEQLHGGSSGGSDGGADGASAEPVHVAPPPAPAKKRVSRLARAAEKRAADPPSTPVTTKAPRRK